MVKNGMFKNKNGSKKTIPIVAILLGIALLGGTFALVILGLNVVNGNYVWNTTCFDINYSIENDDGTMDITGTLIPSSNPKGGLTGKVSIGVDPDCSVNARGNIYFNINNVSSKTSILTQTVREHCENSQTLETLTNYSNSSTCTASGGIWVTDGSALKYAVYEGTESNPSSVGYINSVSEAATLYDNFKVHNEMRDYNIFIWLDGHLIDNTYASIPLSGYISAEVIQADDTTIPEAPVLDENGMIPVTIEDNGMVTTISSTDDEWYDYARQEWANAILVTDDSRSKYLNTTDVIVNQSDILAYYVWIPRYKYRIPKITCASIPETERNMNDYPECYAPYTISDTDKDKLVTYFEAEYYCIGDETHIQEASTVVSYALENGEFIFSKHYGTSILDWVEAYNNGTISNCGAPGGTISITASNFNGSNTLYGTGSEVSIDIAFEPVEKVMSLGNAVTTYKTHPAFWWDDDSDGIVDNGEMLSGIWVGKFESTPDKSSTCYSSPSMANCNNVTQNPTILPNEAPLKSQQLSNQFTTSQKFSISGNIYGLTYMDTDGHMMKNSEWGGVVYLSHSVYGINKKIRINNYYNSNDKYYKTGCGALEDNAEASTTCEIAYGSGGSEYPQSTTGNISGIFDMSGGAWDYVMGNYGNQTNTYFSILPDSKYYDLYDITQFNKNYSLGNATMCTLETCGGHALNETYAWYTAFPDFVNSNGPWFMRGGHAGASVRSSINAFSASYNDGEGGRGSSWRSVLVID